MAGNWPLGSEGRLWSITNKKKKKKNLKLSFLQLQGSYFCSNMIELVFKSLLQSSLQKEVTSAAT